MKTGKILFYASLSCVILLGATFLVMKPVALSGNDVLIRILGIVFWVLLAGSIVFGVLASAAAKKNVPAETWQSMRPGIISFFKTRIGKAADIIFAVSLIMVIVSANTQLKYSYVMYVFLLAVAVSFGMHCLYNGRTYRSFEICHKADQKKEFKKKTVNIQTKKREKYNGKH